MFGECIRRLLSRGAVRMARRKVIVKRLASIHDLGAMTVLCTDKTGTLTSAEIVLASSLNAKGEDDPRISMLAGVCAELAGDPGIGLRGDITMPFSKHHVGIAANEMSGV